MLIVERWILARLRQVRFFSLADLNAAIGMLLEDLNNRPMRRLEERVRWQGYPVEPGFEAVIS